MRKFVFEVRINLFLGQYTINSSTKHEKNRNKTVIFHLNGFVGSKHSRNNKETIINNSKNQLNQVDEGKRNMIFYDRNQNDSFSLIECILMDLNGEKKFNILLYSNLIGLKDI